MIISVSIVISGKGAATPVSLVNFSIVSSFLAQLPDIGQMSVIAAAAAIAG